MSSPQRQKWMKILALASTGTLETLCADLLQQVTYRYLRRPECGSIMLRGRTGGQGDAFNMGEATLTRCTLKTGSGAVGTAYVLGRSHRKAELAALCDALLQDAGHHHRIMETIINPLEQAQGRRNAARAGQAAATKVDFFTMTRGE